MKDLFNDFNKIFSGESLEIEFRKNKENALSDSMRKLNNKINKVEKKIKEVVENYENNKQA